MFNCIINYHGGHPPSLRLSTSNKAMAGQAESTEKILYILLMNNIVCFS